MVPGRVLSISCGPRRGGNSETLLEAFLEPALRAGVPVIRLRVHEMEIHPCNCCGGCGSSGKCVLRDAMDAVYPLLLKAHEVILATPVYFYNFPGKAKSFIDRAQPLWARKYRPSGGVLSPVSISPPGRKGFLLATGASRGASLFKGLELTARYFFDAVDAPLAGSLTVPGVDAASDLSGMPRALDGARAAGAGFLGEAIQRAVEPARRV